MRKIKILTVLCIFLSSVSFTYAQDSTLYKVKLAKFQVKEHNGKITTIIGASTIVIGGGISVAGELTAPTDDVP